MPFQFPTVEITFEALGAPELHATVKDPRALPFGQVRKLREAGSNLSDEAAMKFLAGVVVDWNLTDESGAPLPAPKGPEDFDALPVAVVDHLATSVVGLLNPNPR